MEQHNDLLEFKQNPVKKVLIAVGVVTLVLAIVAAIVLAVLLGPWNQSDSQTSGESLRVSAPGELLQLVRLDATRPNGDKIVVARSFDTKPWEIVPDQDTVPHEFTCSSPTSCVVKTPGRYEVQKVEIPSFISQTTAKERVARFLSQSTFGPTRAEIEDFLKNYGASTDGFLKWINDQSNLPPTLLRRYLRERTNQRQRTYSHVGSLYLPCEVGSRWHQYSFSIWDEGKIITVSNNEVSGSYTIRIGGVLRTEVGIRNFTLPANTTFPAEFLICDVDERLNGAVRLSTNKTGTAQSVCSINFMNVPIRFTNPDPATTKVLGPNDVSFDTVRARPGVFIVKTISIPIPVPPAVCVGDAWTFFGHRGNFYKYDPRLKLIQNSLDNPADSRSAVSLGQTCPAVAKTFVNRPFCVRRESCAPYTFSAATFTLDDDALRFWYTDSGRYVYVTSGLRLEPPYDVSPCGRRSRWLRIAGPCINSSTLNDQTLRTLANSLVSSLPIDTNRYIRDMSAPAANCTLAGSIGVTIQAGGQCFQHVHPDTYSVRDYSFWTLSHDGNAAVLNSNQPNPIAKFAEQLGSVTLSYPRSHGMDRWQMRVGVLQIVGRYGDSVQFSNLPTELQTFGMANRVGALASQSGSSFEACGSPGEVANVPTRGHRYYMPDVNPRVTDGIKAREMDFRHPFNSGKSMLWTNIVLTARDQLRHRAAWAIAQILTTSAVNFGRGDENEPWATYYDIFVRNAFGNYRDILKEVSYSPIMATYLSFLGNRASAVSGTFPDENYAREIMQLFTIGLWKLNDDGNQALDASGNPQATYTDQDIIDWARLWTGFDVQLPRSNIEAQSGRGSTNVMDPLQLKPANRDLLPKANLDDGFLGDRYPLCDDLPPQHWVKQGARYKFTGPSSIEGATMDREEPTGSGNRGRFTLNPKSELYKRLCDPTPGGACTFPTEVVLDTNLPCDGLECTASRVISVKIVDNVAGLTRYYSYVSIPCVRLTFYDQGQITLSGTDLQCTNPKHKVAMPLCCAKGSSTTQITSNNRTCEFANEAMDYETAKSRCQDAGHGLCNLTNAGATWTRTCAANQYQWMNNTCSLRVQVYSTGQIAIIDPSVNPSTTAFNFKTVIQNGNSIFRVRWNGGSYPNPKVSCGTCRTVSTAIGDSCVCPLDVTDSVVFTDPSSLPNAATILSSLSVGAAPPSSFGPNVYSQCTTGACARRSDVKVWVKSGTTGWDASTIFELPPPVAGAAKIYLANINSIVTVADQYSFRNPPHFMPLAGEHTDTGRQWSSVDLWSFRADQETEAGIDYLFRHPTTAPFICYRLIQRLVTSNPSPRYMRSVVSAFRTGTYDGVAFSGNYGDLKATFAAILLDPEARSVAIEVDPSFGKFKEPLLKVISFMRSMEYTTREVEVILANSQNSILSRIGQEAFNAPSVFGFYLPDNRPDGPVGEMGLVAPEAQLSVPPLIVGYLNGMMSLIDNGLTNCNGGFGYEVGKSCGTAAAAAATADGNLTYTPSPSYTPAQVVDELALLLTSGRLHPSIRSYIAKRYQTVANTAAGPSGALKLAQKLMAAAPEFHADSAHILTNRSRVAVPPTPSKNRPYKAIVVIFMAGGCDSFSMLIPFANCSDNNGTPKNLYAEYRQVRGDGGGMYLPSSILPIAVPPKTQPCDTFALHGSMPNVKRLYDAGESLFIANIGALIEPITKADWLRTSGRPRRYPPSLFAHDVMTRHMNSLHPQNQASKGVLGRMVTALQSQPDPYRCELYSLTGTTRMLEGSRLPDFIDPNNGITRFSQYSSLADDLGNLTEFEADGTFGETWARLLRSSLEKTEALGAELASTTVGNFPNDGLSQQLRQVARIIKMRNSPNLQTERAVFVTARGGYDTHGTFDLRGNLGQPDAAIAAFAAEMKAQGIWDDVVVLTVSEFGRTMNSNGLGTDHAWGGNYYLSGGAVKGGQILGQYPDTLTEDGSVRVGRFAIPTTPWEAVWKGLAEWYGVSPDQMAKVLPNFPNFPDSSLFTKQQLFKK